MTTENATPAPAPEPNPSPKKGFSKEWKIMTAIGAIVIIALGMVGVFFSIGDDAKDIVSIINPNKLASTQPVAGNTASSTASTPVKGNIIPASTVKGATTAPATGEVSTAKVEVKAEGGKLRVDFDSCCNCKTASVPPKASTQSRKSATPPIASVEQKKEALPPSVGGNQLAWRHPDAEAGKGPRECFFEKVDRSHLERYANYCNKGILFPKNDASESRTTWNKRVNAEWSEKYRKHDEPRLVAPKELDSVTYKVRPGT